MAAQISTDAQDNYEILKLVLNGIDIRNEFISLSIYENIFENDITMSIDFLETKNYLEVNPFEEGTVLEIEYFSKYPPKIKKMETFVCVFDHYKTEKVKSPNKGKKIYRMHFVTQEQHKQSMLLVSRPYRDQTSTDIINSIFGFTEPSVGINIEPSDDFIPLYVVPRLNPWNAINNICRNALKINNNDYVFYRDKYEYVCKPLTILKEEPAIEEYKMEQTSLDWEYDKQIEYRNIKGWKQEKPLWNSLQNINSGLYGSSFHKYNALTKMHEYLEEEGKDTAFSGNENLHIFDVDNYYNRELIADYRQDRLYKIGLLNEERVILEVRTNTNLTVGKTIDLKIPTTKELSIIDASVSKEDDKRLTGKYLITKLRHQINRSDSMMVMEVIKI